MKALALAVYTAKFTEEWERDPSVGKAASEQRIDARDGLTAYIVDGRLYVAVQDDPEPGMTRIYKMPEKPEVQVVIPQDHLAAIIEDAVRERTADLEMRLRNRNEQIANLDKHRHDLYQERDELLHRIEHMEGCLQDEQTCSLEFRRTPEQAREQPRPPAHIWREVLPDRESPRKRDEEGA